MTINVSPSVVRQATQLDHQEVWRLFLMAHRENGLFKLAPQKVEYFLQRALNPQNIHPQDIGPRGEVAVIGAQGKLEAIGFMLISQFWYSEDYHLEELVVFVDPECRHSEHAKKMIEWMKKSADTLKIPLLTGIISRDRTEAKIRLYDRYLPRIGGFYLYPLTGKDVKKRNHNMEKQAWLAARG